MFLNLVPLVSVADFYFFVTNNPKELATLN